MRSCPSITGRILTVLSLVFLVILSFSVIAPTVHASSSFNLRKRAIQARQRFTSATDPPDPPTSSASTSTRSISRPSPSPPHPPPPPPPPPTTSASSTIQPLPSTSFLLSPTSTTPTTTSTPRSQPSPSTQTSTSLSSSSTSTFSSIVAIVTPIALPKTTFSVPTSTFFPKTSSVPEPTATSQALKKTFWKDKGAVVATFTVTSLVIFAGILVIILMVIRRRNIRNQPNDEYFEKYNENSARHADFADDVSTHSLTAPAGADAYPDRQIHYGSDPNASAIYRQDAHSQSHEQDVGDMYTPDEYGIHYPPGTAYSTDQAELSQYSPGRHAQSELPLSDPANYERDETGLVPPVAFREPIAREQVGRDSYQQSIDSFYIAQAR